MIFWDLVYYGWFAFLALAVFSVIFAAVWESTAPKRRLRKAAREQAKREQEAAAAAADSAETPPAEAAAEEGPAPEGSPGPSASDEPAP